ncbi:hypothetical protein EYC84_007690 [Monilinia fructicola]|uniref:Uncharacterized protein n=1 Tax=Monilinia fructicola TaxID=38448 RepID=A0A5M9JL34_MONFR|nr:hypothetical protein EYC84_007690 [Monilinia fructicola]
MHAWYDERATGYSMDQFNDFTMTFTCIFIVTRSTTGEALLESTNSHFPQLRQRNAIAIDLSNVNVNVKEEEISDSDMI